MDKIYQALAQRFGLFKSSFNQIFIIKNTIYHAESTCHFHLFNFVGL